MFTNEFILVENRLVPFWVSDYGACILIHFKIALGYINPIRIFTRLEKLMRFENFSKMIFYFQKLPTETSEKKITVTNRKGTFFHFIISTSRFHLEIDIAQLIPF